MPRVEKIQCKTICALLFAWCSTLVVEGHPASLECGGDLHSRLEVGTCGGSPTKPKPCQIMGQDVLFGRLNESGVRITSNVGDYFSKTFEINFQAPPLVEFVLEGLDGVHIERRSGNLAAKENCDVTKKNNGGSQLYTNYSTPPSSVESYSIHVKPANFNRGMIYLGWAQSGPPVTSTLFEYVLPSNIKSPNNGVCYGDKCLGGNAIACCQRSSDPVCQIKNRSLTPKESASCNQVCCQQQVDPTKGRMYWTCPDQKPASECYPPLR